MADAFLQGAERHQLDDAPMAGDGGQRVIWHITWDKNATAAAPADLVPFDNLVGYFTSGGAGMAPHLIWDPFTGRIAQMFSATSRSKAVVNAPGGVETNRKGDICIQIEILFFPYCRVDGKVYATVADTPCVGLDRIMAWLRSWGVPDVWPMGAPDWNSHRDAGVWDTRSGHYGHSQVPENDHTDPGPMPDLFTPLEDDVTPQDIEAIAAAVWQYGLHNPARPEGYTQAAGDFQLDQDRKFDLLNGELQAVAAKVDLLAAAGGATEAQLQAAAQAGAQAALAQLAAALTAPKGS